MGQWKECRAKQRKNINKITPMSLLSQDSIKIENCYLQTYQFYVKSN